MKILLVQTGFLGDLLLSTAVIRNLALLYPDSELSVMTTPQAASLLAGHPNVAHVIRFDKRGSDRGLWGLTRMARRLRAGRFDIAFSLHKSARTALVLALAGIPKRYGFAEASLRFLYTKTSKRSDLGHDVLRNLAVLRTVGHSVENLDQRLDLVLTLEAETAAIEALAPLAGREFVAIAPGSVWLTKRWTEDGFAELCRALDRMGHAVVLIGGKDDAETASDIERRAGIPLLNLVGSLALPASAAVIRRAALLVTNDSAPLHMGSSFQVPMVAVFCATVPEFGYGPWKTQFEIVDVDGLECRPCGRHGGQSCPTGTHACRIGVTPVAVAAACMRLLSQGRQ